MQSESKKQGSSRKLKITAFYCINALRRKAVNGVNILENIEVKEIKISCSSSIKDVYMLRAFESDSDAVIVFACSDGQCYRVDGNIRAQKRVEYTKGILKEIGYDEKRLSFVTVSAGNANSFEQVIRKTADELEL